MPRISVCYSVIDIENLLIKDAASRLDIDQSKINRDASEFFNIASSVNVFAVDEKE
jgi:hypothetical protein